MKKWMQRRYFLRLLLTVSSLAAALIVPLSAVLFSCFSNLTMENIHRADRNAVSQISYGKEYMDMVAEDLGRMLYTNNYIVSAITGSAYDPIVSTQAINTMQMLVLSNDGIDSIYYYNRKLGRVASSRTGEFSPIGEFYDGGSREPRAPQPPVPQERAAPARPDGRRPAVGGERRAAARRPRDSLL